MNEGGSFEIGSQQAVTINQAGRDQFTGPSHGTFVAGAQQAAVELRAALAETHLRSPERRKSEAALEALEAELGAEVPDKGRAAGHLQRLTDLLASAGALTSSADRLATPIKQLAGWLGDAGSTIIRSLG